MSYYTCITHVLHFETFQPSDYSASYLSTRVFTDRVLLFLYLKVKLLPFTLTLLEQSAFSWTCVVCRSRRARGANLSISCQGRKNPMMQSECLDSLLWLQRRHFWNRR